MVFGLILAIALVGATAKFVGLMMNIGISGTLGNGSFMGTYIIGAGGLITALMSFAAGIILVTGIMVVVSHKVFGLITWLPENAMKWAGHQGGASLGEAGDERRVAAIFASGGQSVGGMPGGMTKDPKADKDGGPVAPNSEGGEGKDTEGAGEGEPEKTSSNAQPASSGSGGSAGADDKPKSKERGA